MSLAVLVAGATGRFGGISRSLVERGHRVRALTRRPTSPVGQELRLLGADVTYGDFDDADSLQSAMRGMDAVFASGTMHRAGLDGERRHGGNIAEAVRAAGIGHLVYVSGAGAGIDTGVPLFDLKGDVEQRIRLLEVPHTIVAPVYLMENLFNPWNLSALESGRLTSYVSPDRRLQQVPVVDVVSFSVLALERREYFLGQRVEIASDEVSSNEMADDVSRATGHPYLVEEKDSRTLGPGLSALFEWSGRTGHGVDMQALRGRHPEVGWHSFEEWVGSMVGLRAE